MGMDVVVDCLPIRIEVLLHHGLGEDDSVLFWQVSLRERGLHIA